MLRCDEGGKGAGEGNLTSSELHFAPQIHRDPADLLVSLVLRAARATGTDTIMKINLNC